MTMRLVQVGRHPITGLPRFGYVHPFLAGARKQELRVPDTHITKKTKREVPAWRCVADGATRPVMKEKYNRANR